MYYRNTGDTLFSYLLNGNRGLIAYYRLAFTPQHIEQLTNRVNAGLGHTHEGGIIGLARAFQLTGTANVVMSRWNIADNATADRLID